MTHGFHDLHHGPLIPSEMSEVLPRQNSDHFDRIRGARGRLALAFTESQAHVAESRQQYRESPRTGDPDPAMISQLFPTCFRLFSYNFHTISLLCPCYFPIISRLFSSYVPTISLLFPYYVPTFFLLCSYYFPITPN